MQKSQFSMKYVILCLFLLPLGGLLAYIITNMNNFEIKNTDPIIIEIMFAIALSIIIYGITRRAQNSVNQTIFMFLHHSIEKDLVYIRELIVCTHDLENCMKSIESYEKINLDESFYNSTLTLQVLIMKYQGFYDRSDIYSRNGSLEKFNKVLSILLTNTITKNYTGIIKVMQTVKEDIQKDVRTELFKSQEKYSAQLKEINEMLKNTGWNKFID